MESITQNMFSMEYDSTLDIKDSIEFNEYFQYVQLLVDDTEELKVSDDNPIIHHESKDESLKSKIPIRRSERIKSKNH